MLAMGGDCARHPLLGCIIANNGTSPGDQARSFLISLHNATFHKVAGRADDFTDADYREWMAKLEAWEKTNAVPLPPPHLAAEFSRRR
jgi:hypothetical protein